MTFINFADHIDAAEAYALANAKDANPTNATFFNPIRRWKKKKKPDITVAFTNTENVGVVETAFTAMQEKETNWRIDDTLENALLKKTQQSIRQAG